MGTIDIVELENRLSSELNIVNSFNVKHEDYVNRTGRKNISEDSKELIGSLGHIQGVVKTAKEFGLSPATVSGFSKGMSSTTNGEYNGELEGKVKVNVRSVRDKVSDLALGKLEKVIEAMTEDKIKDASLVQLSMVASNLGKLSRVEEGEGDGNVKNNFIFYVPENKKEIDYKIVEVND